MDEKRSYLSERTLLRDYKDELVEKVMSGLAARYPHYAERMGAEGWHKCRNDVAYHILYLADAVGAESQRLFIEYVKWVKVLFASLGVPNDSFLESLKLLREQIDLNTEQTGTAVEYLDAVITAFEQIPEDEETFIIPDQPLSTLAKEYQDALLNRRRDKAIQMVLDAVEAGTDIRDIYEYVFQVSQWEIGRLWQQNRVSVAQEHYCTAVTQLVMSRLYPYIFNREKNGLVFVGTSVGDELHELGIRMIADFFELAGWDTVFLGASTPVDSLVDTAAAEGSHVVGISVTITYHIGKAQEIIKALRARLELKGVKILVGGYPFNLDAELWRKVGADGTAASAREAIKKAHDLIEEKHR